MKKIIIILLITSLCQPCFSQNIVTKYFPTSALSLQYAGSIGWLSAGYFRQTPNKKIELGFLYGHTPQAFGGPLNSFTIKFIYNPFKIELSPKFHWEPIQTGVWITGWFGENVDISWSNRYPKGYYWWQSSTRKHVFVSTQMSLMMKKVDRLSFYFEANTNDLYLYNYLPNTKTVNFYDIIFYGLGIKVYF